MKRGRFVEWRLRGSCASAFAASLQFASGSDYTYNSAGQLIAESYPNGVHIFYDYDSLGYLLERRQRSPRVNPQADLAISLVASPSPASVGELVAVTITVTNNGIDPATGVSVVDAIPGGLEDASATSSQGGVELAGGTLEANLGTLPGGASATITITGTVTGSIALAFNPAVSAPEDGNAANNTAATSVTIDPSQLADLSLELASGPHPAFAPGKLSFQAVVANNGPSDSTATSLTLTLPVGASFNSASHPATPSGNTVTIDLGALASGESVTTLAKINPPAGGGNVEVTAEVSTAQTDPDASNETASSSVNVLAGTLVVTNANDGGAGSLRQAITDANNNAGLDIITFDISGASIPEIQPTTRMPILRGELVIDGFSQPGGLVEIDGGSINDAFSFGILEMRGSEIAVRGMVLNNHLRSSGISVEANFAQDLADFHETLSIVGCLIGVEPDGTTAAGNKQDGIVITEAESVQIGGTKFWERNIVSGNDGTGIDIRSNVIRDVRVINNFIGTDITGTVAIPNDDEGIQCTRVDEVKIFDNLISGNDSIGLQVAGDGVVVQGNIIGLDASGTVGLPNRLGGLKVNGAFDSDVLIGGSFMGQGNVISGNRVENVDLSGNGVTLTGNMIGPNQTGDTALSPANNIPGIEVNVDGPTFIGLPVANGGNVISGNSGEGIFIDSRRDHVIRNNRIGTSSDGLAALENSTGVALSSAPDNVIGGSLEHEGNLISGNLISGNRFSGIGLSFPTTSNTIIQGDFIGVDVEGGPLGNGSSGVNNNNASGTIIGGVFDGEGNTIAHNAVNGARVIFGTASVLGNSIHSNGGLGIKVGFGADPLPNDAGDVDTGANDFQNFPIITQAAGSVTGTLNSQPEETYRIEFFANSVVDGTGHGEGETFLGFEDVTTDVAGNVNFTFNPAEPLPLGQFVTATATDPDGHTSEFGLALLIEAPTGFVDSDGDGMSDDFELANFGSITGGDPAADPDGDGQNNLAEFIALTDTNDASSRLKVSMSIVDGELVLRIASEVGRVYQLEASDNLQGFQPIGPPVVRNGDFIEFVETIGTSRFYRLEVSLP